MVSVLTYLLALFTGILLARAFRSSGKIDTYDTIESNASVVEEGDGIQCGRAYGAGSVCNGRENQYGTLLKVRTTPAPNPCACDSSCIYTCPDDVVWSILFCAESAPVQVEKGRSGLAFMCKGEECACKADVQNRDKENDERVAADRREAQRRREQEEMRKKREQAEKERAEQIVLEALQAKNTAQQQFLDAAAKNGPGQFMELRSVADLSRVQGKPAPACVLIHGGNMLKQTVARGQWLSSLVATHSMLLFYTSSQGAADWGQGLWKQSIPAGAKWPVFQGTYDVRFVQSFKSRCAGEQPTAQGEDSGSVGCCLINGAGGCSCDDTVTRNQCGSKMGIGSAMWTFKGAGLKCKNTMMDCFCQ